VRRYTVIIVINVIILSLIAADAHVKERKWREQQKNI